MATRLVAVAALAAAALAHAQTFYIDCENGSDQNGSGSASSPWQTPQRAAVQIRQLPRPLTAPVTVSILPGTCYPRNLGDGTLNYSVPILSLDDAIGDSGSGASAPIVWRAAAGPGSVVFSGGLPLPASGWTPYAARSGCYMFDLSSLAYNASAFGFGSLAAGGLGTCVNNGAELFYDATPALLARYPNVAANGTWQFMHISSVPSANSINVDDTRPLTNNWAAEGDGWLHGFWSFDWADSYVRLAGAAAAANSSGTTTLSTDPSTPPLYGYLKGARFIATSLLAELDAANEYFVDRSGSGAVYYCTPDGAAPTATAVLSMSAGVVTMSGSAAAGAEAHRTPLELMRAAALPPSAHESAAADAAATGAGVLQYVTLDGIDVMYSRGTGVLVSSAANLVVQNLFSANHGHNGVSLQGVLNSTVSNVTVSGTGCGGMTVSGGSTATLSPGGNLVEGCTVHSYARMCRTYNPGIGWYGVGNVFRGNEMYNAPHQGFLGGGNDNLFTGNYLHDLCYEVTDSGAWYAGRSWIARGNVLINNTFERIYHTEQEALGAPAVQAVYFDDQLSGQVMINNTIRDAYNGLLLGGGRDNIVQGNTFINMLSGTAMTFDDRGLNWQSETCTYNATYTGLLVQQLLSVNYTQPPYSTAYPPITQTLNYYPCTPVNNTITGNTWCNPANGSVPAGQGRFIDRNASVTAAWHSTVANNVQTNNC